MTQLTVSTWNINQRSNKKGDIPNLVIDELEKLNLDIICLSEYVKSSNHTEFYESLENLGYSVFVDPRNEILKNEILIAVKNNLAQDTKIKFMPLGELYPNFLHLETKIGNDVLHIIGVRVQISYIDKEQPYRVKFLLQVQDAKERLEQIKHAISYI
ncbi:TPA: endonuclease/exonuclease/phosphatase family protein, partial [Streptococcus suis]